MPGPPPKPKGPDDLAEVERALSVLQGRHPEHERVRREQEEARVKRKADLDAVAKAEHAEARARQIKIGAIAGGVLVVATVIALLFRRELVRRSKIEQSTDPYRAMGFVVADTSARGTPGRLDANVDPACYLAVSTDAVPIEVALGSTKAKGPGPVLFCACAGEKVAVTSEVAEGGGLSLMRVDTAVTGGSRAFAFSPVKPGTVMKADDACAEASLDAWIDAKRFPPATADDKWLIADPKRAPIASAGGRVIAILRAEQPFAVIDVPTESCLVAVSDAPGDKLSLRAKGGATAFPPADGSFAWCAQGASTTTLVREGEGRGTVTALAVPAVKVGGLRGLRELARTSRVSLGYSAIAPDDLSWDAKMFLLASAVPEALITTASTPDIAPEPDARLVALSVTTPNALLPELETDTFSYCEPALDERMRESLCLFSGSQTWRTRGAEASGGLARAKLPFWLFGLQGVNDPVALREGLRLVDLARRLRKEGFEPTAMEALAEEPNGVDVLGRAGEDAIVAVGVAPVEPWVFTYTDGPPWSLDDVEPRVIPITTLQTLKLTASARRLPPKDKRRSVIFRRAKR